MEISIEKIVKALRDTDPYIEDIFTHGGCYRFHLFLKKLFPESVPYINKTKDHIITRLDNKYYDVKGKVAANELW